MADFLDEVGTHRLFYGDQATDHLQSKDRYRDFNHTLRTHGTLHQERKKRDDPSLQGRAGQTRIRPGWVFDGRGRDSVHLRVMPQYAGRKVGKSVHERTILENELAYNRRVLPADSSLIAYQEWLLEHWEDNSEKAKR